MKTLAKSISLLLLAVLPLVVSAQERQFPRRDEIANVESNGDMVLEVFNHPENGENNYYLSVGHLGMGDDVVQVLFDPVCELFIPLGNTLLEARESLEKMKELYKADPGTVTEMPGCLSFGVPDGNWETVKVTYRKVLLSRQLLMSLERQGYIRATVVTRSDLGSLIFSMKIYQKLHPGE